jgi:hypothetical protein
MLAPTEQPFSGDVNDIDQALLPEIVESIKTNSSQVIQPFSAIWVG